MTFLTGVLCVLGVVFFILLSGLFSSLETAFICSEYLRVKRLKYQKPQIYEYLNKIFSNPEHFLSTILVGNNLCIVIISSLVTWMLIYAKIENVSFWVSLFLTPVIIVFAEMVPKSIGRTFQSRFLVYFVGAYKFLELILRPLVLFMEFVPFKVIKFFIKKKKISLSKDDIKLLTETLHNQGKIKKLEKEAIEDVLGFSKDRVKDVYLPLKKVAGIDFVDNLNKIMVQAKEYGYTRYPVFKNKSVVGYLNIFDLFYREFNEWQELIRDIPKISINQRLDDVFFLLKKRRENFALVYKGRRPYGFVSMQDLMREITASLAKV